MRILASLVVVALLLVPSAAGVGIAGIPNTTLTGPMTVAAGSSATYIGSYRIGGFTPPAGQTVRLFDDDALIATTTTSANGAFSFTVALLPGLHQLVAQGSGPSVLSDDSIPVNVRVIYPPAAPLGLAATQGPTVDGVRLTWSAPLADTTRPVTAWHVYRDVGAGWVELGQTAAHVRSFEIGNLDFETLHRFAVRARNAAGYSSYAEQTIAISAFAPTAAVVDRISFQLCWYGANGNVAGCRAAADGEEILFEVGEVSLFEVSPRFQGRLLAGSLLVTWEDVTTSVEATIPGDPPAYATETATTDHRGVFAMYVGTFTWEPPTVRTGSCYGWWFEGEVSSGAASTTELGTLELCEA